MTRLRPPRADWIGFAAFGAAVFVAVNVVLAVVVLSSASSDPQAFRHSGLVVAAATAFVGGLVATGLAVRRALRRDVDPHWAVRLGACGPAAALVVVAAFSLAQTRYAQAAVWLVVGHVGVGAAVAWGSRFGSSVPVSAGR